MLPELSSEEILERLQALKGKEHVFSVQLSSNLMSDTLWGLASKGMEVVEGN